MYVLPPLPHRNPTTRRMELLGQLSQIHLQTLISATESPNSGERTSISRENTLIALNIICGSTRFLNHGSSSIDSTRQDQIDSPFGDMRPLPPKPSEDLEQHASHLSLADDEDSSPASFTKFAELPTELRLHIWRAALPSPRVIYIAEYRMDDLEDWQDDWDDDTPRSMILVPSRLHSAGDFAIERSCIEARDLVASTYKPIIFPPPDDDPQKRRWNGFASWEFGVDTESPIAWPEDIHIDLSRDILYLSAPNVMAFRTFFKMRHLDLPRVLKETRRLAIPVNAFIDYDYMEEKDSTRGNSMVNPNDREFEVFDDMEANMPQSIEILTKFENVTDVMLSMCWGCHLQSDLPNKISKYNEEEWQDWGLVPCSLSSLPTSAPPEDPADRAYQLRSADYLNENNVRVDRRIQLRAFQARRIVQVLEKEKQNGRLGRVEKIQVVEAVLNVTKAKYYTPGWHHCCRVTGEEFSIHSRMKDQDVRFI